MKNYHDIISAELGISARNIENTLKLFESGATIPFIARYRKELTGSLDEISLTSIRDRMRQLQEMDARRATIINTIKEQGKLTSELEELINRAATLSELEDIYLPYKPKRKTKASIAREKGLEPLAKLLMAQKFIDVELKASEFINEDEGISNSNEALAGARDIISEWVNENKKVRERIRNLFINEATILSKVAKDKQKEGIKYEQYFEWEESISKAPSHRILAMFRGEKESFLKLTISPLESKALEIIEKIYIKDENDSAYQVQMAIKDSYKRLAGPSIETEIRQMAKEKADEEAIRVFAENLRQLLLSPPLGQKNVLALDPGFKSGCKLVCLDKQGKLLHNETIYPHPPQRETKLAAKKILSLVNAYKIDAIAIGNGTAGRETEHFIRKIHFDRELMAIMVNENGASVYSASAVAREEFPEYDVTVRGSVSIGRRLMDPLAELVKIDPKSIGVGQYQHDVNQNALQQSLEDIVVSCTNAVGVEVNTASKELLTYVSGVGPSLAKSMVEYRNKHGAFKTREDLKKVSRFGNKAFEQAAGFLRIHHSENPLDKSAVHPESYDIVKKMALKVNGTIEGLMNTETLRKQIILDEFVTNKVGMPTLKDIMEELAKPGRDPRKKFDIFEFDKSVNSITDIKTGMVLPGIITNITAFGAFVDIGVHQDGLVHISQLANEFVSDPNTVVSLNQKVMVKVLDLDIERKRIQLSLKDIE